jgi:CheY-like chemotaxis protein
LGFKQEDNSTTRKFGGTGLGLSISSSLIKQMHGELKVDSTLHQGSCFYFILPVEICALESKHDEMLKPQKDAYLNPLQGHILVVEDNKTNQMLMGMILDDLGLSYEIANDGVERVDLFKQHEYDLVLMDENMPNMNGIEAAQHMLALQQKNCCSETPIIAITANSLKEDKERFLDAGMSAYLSKPYTEEEIRTLLERFLIKGL